MSFGKADKTGEVTPGLGPQERINFRGDLNELFGDALANYDFGTAVRFTPKQNGYEDFNVELDTPSGPVFAKCFASWRSTEECQRYLQMIEAAYHEGVRTPRIFHNADDSPLTVVNTGGVITNLCLMEFLDGGNIWESDQPLSSEEQAEVIRQAANINKSSYHPNYVHDSWAIPNIAENYTKSQEHISAEDRIAIEPLLAELTKIDIDKLPHAFVHGDIRSTNVMRHHDNLVYIIDFSVANFYPRVVELAVISSDVLFDASNPTTFVETYEWALDEYQKAGVEFTEYERQILPLFVKLGHAANVIGASSVGATNYISQAENDHWLHLGQQGIQSLADWKG